MFEKMADYLIEHFGMVGLLLVAVCMLATAVIRTLWKAWRDSETALNTKREEFHGKIQEVQQEKFETVMDLNNTTNVTLTEIKTLLYQVVSKLT